MTLKRTIWLSVALILTTVNVLGLGWALALQEGPHAGAHVALSVLCGWWAYRLLRPAGPSDATDAPAALDQQERFDALESDVNRLRQELGEAQERVDFAERMLATRADPHRVDQQRP